MARQLSFVSDSDPAWKRRLVATIEDLSGRHRFLPLYADWQARAAADPTRRMQAMLDVLDVTLAIDPPTFPPPIPAGSPLVMIANHPYGLADGMMLLALAERLGRPFRILINKDLLRVPEMVPLALPIDFADTKAAIAGNLVTRAEARRLLASGTTIVVFPAGGVATAPTPFAPADELPWKTFTARLVQQAEAAVLPVYFDGQNSALFHLVSRVSLTLRLSLLVSELRRFPGRRMPARVGELVPFSALECRQDRRALTEELYARVLSLAPGNADQPLSALRQKPVAQRPRFPWDDGRLARRT
jgi:putative hemolysin